tara:strand:+ start:2912 stop:3757 length:846 start_codon:yes stop_codon:yes gene_type:complete
MIRSVLVALDSGENMDIVLKYGLEMAQYFESQAHGIHVLDIRKLYSPFMEDVLYSAGLSSVPNLQGLVRERMMKLKEILHAAWKHGVDQHQLKGAFQCPEGIVSEELANEARKHDLLVIGTKGENFQLSQLLVGSTFNEVVQLVNRPIMVVPNQVSRFYIRRVLVAYDGSPRANNALHFVIQSVRDYNLECELIVCKDETLLNAEDILKEAQEILERASIEFKARLIQGPASQMILDHATVSNSDVICMGRYSGALIKDLFVGGVARQVITQSQIPILLMR